MTGCDRVTSAHRQPAGEALFFWVRWRMWRAGIRALWQAPAKLVVMTITWTVLLAGLSTLCDHGVRFIYNSPGFGPFLLSRLWYLLLFVILAMLGISQVASAYSTFIRAPETRWWMVLPVSARTLCRVKWVESSVYSAWAVLLLLLPLTMAYVRVLNQPLYLVAAIGGLVFVPLLGIMTAISTIGLLVWLRCCSRFVVRGEWIPLGFVVASIGFFWLLGEQRSTGQQDVWFVALQALLPRMRIAMSGWLPSRWAATAMLAWLEGRRVECAVYTALLWTTLFVAWRVLDHLSAALLWPVLRQHAQPALGEAAPARRGKGHAPWWVRHPLLACLTKDALLAGRDPMQWSQAVMFFGLLGAYFANIHRIAQLSVDPQWRIGIAALNLACTLLVFGSLAVRFLFPQMSLEGRNLWLVRIVPRGVRQLFVSKLAFYGMAAVVIIECLLGLSMAQLGVPLTLRWWLALVGVMAAATIVGLTVGLGAWWMDPTSQDAVRMVSSSNGALVLVFVLAYVGCVVAALVLAWLSWLVGAWARLGFISLGLTAISALVCVLSIRLGLARLERLESAV